MLLNAGAEADPNVLNVSTGGNGEDDNVCVVGVSQVQEKDSGIRYL